MKTAHLKPVDKPSGSVEDIPMQPASLDIWDTKYRLKTKDGRIIDETIHDTYRRVARALAEVEATPALREEWYEKFVWALAHGAIPAGRIISNAGALAHKPATSTINCTVSGTIQDSMDDILGKVHEAGLTLKAGSGIGYCFSTLRPRGAYVSGAGAYTSGPLSFMDIFDKMCFTVSSAGGRRGAQMGTFDVGHPDVVDFIRAKRESGRLRQFNLSLLITRGFMEAVKADADWPLAFPLRAQEVQEDAIDLQGPDILWRDWPTREGLVVNEAGLVACRIYRRIRARRLWDLIMSSTYDYAEPGFILIDKVNEMNNNWFCEDIRATNPCVTADTRLHTQHGLVPIGELHAAGGELEVTVDARAVETGPRGTAVRPAKPAFMTARRAPVYRVSTEAGYEIKATEWHDFYTARGKVKLKDLAVGDELLVQSGKGQFGSQGSHELGVLLGLVTGDGHFTHRGGGKEAVVVNLWGEDRCLAERLTAFVNELIAHQAVTARQYTVSPVAVPERNHVFIRSVILTRLLEQLGFSRESKLRVPEVVWRGTEDCVKGYLRGLFQADGTVNVSVSRQSCSVRLASSERGLLQDVQMLLANFGVLSRIHQRRLAARRTLPDGRGGSREYECKADHELIIAGESRDRFMQEVGFLLENKNQRYRDWAGDKLLRKTQRFTSPIARIEYVGEEAVFDTTQADHNTVIFNGLVTGQCGEQPLPEYGACWTGDMRLNTNFGLIRTEDAFALVERGEALQVAVDSEFTGGRTALRPCTLVRNGEKPVFEVAFDNGQRIELTADHRVCTPAGWRAVGELSPGDAVHVQARELEHLDLVDPFHRGMLKFLLDEVREETLAAGDAARRLVLRPLLASLKVPARDGGLDRRHPLALEIAELDLDDAERETLEGYAHAARATAVRRGTALAVCDDEASSRRLAGVLERLTGEPVTAEADGGGSYRVVLPALDIVAPTLVQESAMDMTHALRGWLLTEGQRQGEGEGVDLNEGAAITSRGSLAVHRAPAKAVAETRVPEAVFQANARGQVSFLAAVFCADGEVAADRPAIGLPSPCLHWLEDIQLLLLNFGIHGRIRSHERGLTLALEPRDAWRYYRHIGFPFDATKQGALERTLEAEAPRHPVPAHITARVARIRPLGVQPVYDIEEFSTHTLVVNGVVVHNCLLGSVNLTRFVQEPFTERARFDWETYRRVVAIFTRLLDNVVEINGLPLDRQREEIHRKRRHGMGFLGLGSTLTLLRMPYGSPESVEFTEEAAREMALTGWRTALDLAREKGAAPIMSERFRVTPEMLRLRPEMAADGIEEGDMVEGRVLHARYSRYMRRVAEVDPELVEELEEVGARFTHHSSIAPTGTISLSLANNASNGIEPSFAHHYSRNVIRTGRKTKEKVDVYSFELLAYRERINPRAMPDSQEAGEQLPEYFVTTDDVSPHQHVDIQAAAQRWIDSSISKTINVPTDFAYEDFKDIYLYAYEQGLKGCTTFRFNPEAFQGVLVKDKDLENTTYRFTLEDGSVVELKGNEEVEYDGETHNAANLYDALKEGYYGKF